MPETVGPDKAKKGKFQKKLGLGSSLHLESQLLKDLQHFQNDRMVKSLPVLQEVLFESRNIFQKLLPVFPDWSMSSLQMGNKLPRKRQVSAPINNFIKRSRRRYSVATEQNSQ